MNTINQACMTATEAKQQQSPVAESLDRNLKIAAHIDDQVSRLANRIDSVLAQPSPQKPEATDRQCGESALHDRLLSHGECLNAISRRLEDIINRVTV